jgi:hypothetical protein
MARTNHAVACAFLATALLAMPATVPAFAPLVAGLAKQILQNMIFGEIKGHVIGSLAQMGCKGARLASLLSEVDSKGLLRHGLPGGGTILPPNIGGAAPPSAAGTLAPTGAAIAPGAGPPSPAGGGMLSGLMDKLKSLRGGVDRAEQAAGREGNVSGAVTGTPVRGAMPDVMRMSGDPSLPAGVSRVGPYVMPDMAEAMARMQQQAAAYGGARAAMTPEQMQLAAATMDQARQVLAQSPLSRTETLGVFGELKDMGLLTDDMYAEARDCILLAPESAAQPLGHTGAMLKTMVLPQLAEVRRRLSDLSPEDQARLTDELGAALREAKPSDRKAFREGLGAGFFPPAVLEQLRASGALD